MTLPLFDIAPAPGARIALGEQALVIRGFALPVVPALLEAISGIEAVSPFRQMLTPGGFTMSASLTNCGALGWTSDVNGYRYASIDPATNAPWPTMPDVFARLARDAAAAAGFPDFAADACLVNRYPPGARLSLHQDKNERDFTAPIVSVSLGIPAVFLFGGEARSSRVRRVSLFHGDVAVWGGVDRLRFHGVAPIEDATHPITGAHRINFTFRRAG